jgi:ATP-binding cassette subfamily B protein
MQFPPSVFKFYLKNFWRYCGAIALLYSVLAIIDLFGTFLLPAFALSETVNAIESNPKDMVFHAVLNVAIIYFVLRGLQWGVSLLRWYVFDNLIKYKSYNKISSDLYDYVFKQSTEFYTASMPGKISSQIHQISESFYETIELIFGTATGVLVVFCISASSLFAIGWQYLLVITFAVLFRILWGVFTVKNALRKSAQSAASLNTLQGRLLDALSNFPVVKMFAQAKYEQNFVQPIRKKYQKDACNSHFWSRFFWAPGNLVMDTICFSIFIVLSGYMYSTGQSTVAEISFALATFTAISSVAFNMVMTIKNFTQKWGNAVGSYSVLVKPITIKDAENATELNVRTASINIKNISFKYNKRFILKNFNLSINPGEKVGLVGLSGAGKTTLVNLIMRMYDVNSGQIFIDDQDIKTVTQDSLRKNIAFIPQEPTMFNRTLRENIAYGKPGALDKEVVLAAKNASAHNFICETNDGYDTLVGDRGIKLSGGQRQRIAIARAFLKDSPILILDEATAALDSETEDAIQQSFKKLSHNRTTIVIAHRLSTLKNMDRIIVLDHGKIIESGSHNQLLRDGKIYSKLWKMQSGGFIQE